MAQTGQDLPHYGLLHLNTGPKMTDAGRHPGIKLLTLSEVIDVKGYVGNFEVKILKKARYVSEKDCTACGDCAKVCPVVRPDEFNSGLSSTEGHLLAFSAGGPSAYVININECLGHNPVVCAKCSEVCEKKCINFHMSDEEVVEHVGGVVVATGLEAYDPTELDEYGYTRYRKCAEQHGVRTTCKRRGSDRG